MTNALAYANLCFAFKTFDRYTQKGIRKMRKTVPKNPDFALDRKRTLWHSIKRQKSCEGVYRGSFSHREGKSPAVSFPGFRWFLNFPPELPL